MYKHSKPNYFLHQKEHKKTPRAFVRSRAFPSFFPQRERKGRGRVGVCARTSGRDSSFVITDVGRSVGSVRFGLVFSTSTIVCGMNEWNRTERTNGNGASELATEGARQRERETSGDGSTSSLLLLLSSGVVVVVRKRKRRRKSNPGVACGINSFSFRRETEANAPRSSGTNERRRRLWRGVSSSS